LDIEILLGKGGVDRRTAGKDGENAEQGSNGIAMECVRTDIFIYSFLAMNLVEK